MNPPAIAAADIALERSKKARPPGWAPPGPRPRGSEGRPELSPGPDEEHSFLTGDFRIFQRKRGHRWSLDDFITGFVALEEADAQAGTARALDLGCGIGSVLMMVAWGLPSVRSVGVEAQEVSIAMARRSLAYNGLDDRVELRHGDLRDEAVLHERGAFDLVTGTPPYIPHGQGLVSDTVQRGPCRFETRGGVEDYALAAARVLAPGGVYVSCAGTMPECRLDRALEAAGLAAYRRVEVVPKIGKPVLMVVHAAVREHELASRGGARPIEQFVVRDEDGGLTPDMHRARARLGMPPLGERRSPTTG